jgi:glutamine---fructose-6-phosphate transaminase (isomerizing)
MSLKHEIHEQPQSLARLLDRQRSNIQKIAAEIRKSHPSYAFIAARGTSDNAARYANYLFGAHNHLPVALATPSLFTAYQQTPNLKDALVVAISQSGQSPDIVSVLEEGHRQGRPTLAITNVPDSPAARAADFVIDLCAGPERAVAATKTYTAELLAMAMLSMALGEKRTGWDALARLPAWADATLKALGEEEGLTQRFRYLSHCAVLGRGYNYATAFEWALKLKELTYITAEPYSSADFQHGPIAMLNPGFAVMAIAPSGKVHAELHGFLETLRFKHQVELVVVSSVKKTLALAQTGLPIPAGIPEWLSPIISILPAQVFAWSLTRVKGYDTERPRTIQKVTETL